MLRHRRVESLSLAKHRILEAVEKNIVLNSIGVKGNRAYLSFISWHDDVTVLLCELREYSHIS